MRAVAVFLLFALLACSVSASVMYSRTNPAAGWTKLGRSTSTATHTFQVALKQQNLDVLDKIFWEVSDPEHENYQQFLSTKEIQELTAAPAASVEAVVAFLKAAGIRDSEIDIQGDNIEVITAISNIESAFSVQFFECSHADFKKVSNIAFGSVQVPDSLFEHLDFVTGISNFPNKNYKFGHVNRKVEKVGQIVENDAVLPQTLQNIYGVPSGLKPLSAMSSQGVIEFDGESFSNDDLAQWSADVGIPIANVSAANIVGPNDPTQPGDESSLDIQVMEGINPTSTPWFWLEGGSNWLYSFTTHFLNTTAVPDVISISYGWYEWDQCEAGIGGDECNSLNVTSEQYVERVNTQFQKIGVAGVSIFVASGDSGCHTRYDGECSLPYLLADFPSSSTYITSVGATEVSFTGIQYQAYAPVCSDATYGYNCTYNGTEIAVDSDRAYFTSGGGFSNISTPGAFQAKAISGYLNSGVALPPASYFDPNGRGYPDIAANGHNGYIVLGGQGMLIGGTSQASPFAAGIFALLADTYKSITGNSFGYINPLLYTMWEANANTFIDITVGDNICSEDSPAPCPQCKGYLATKGWDPVSGLGTPNYPAIEAYITSLAHKVVARRNLKAAKLAAKLLKA